MPYTIYLRTNLVNGKQYVGQTIDMERRNKNWNALSVRYANKFLTADREKYGLTSFKTEILAEVETREDAWELEKYYIKELKTKFPNGYNRADGGKDSTGTIFTEEHKKILSDIKKDAHFIPETAFKKGQEPWNKGVKDCFSEETIKKMSESHIGKHNSPTTEFKKGMTPWMKGKHHSAEAIEKNRQAHIGMVSKKRKGIVQLTLDGEFVQEFSHCKDAANVFGLKSPESIRNACVKPNRTSCGFKWMYKEDYEKMIDK